MKKATILLFSLILLFFTTTAFSSSITVLDPNGGESWAIGSTKTIKWNSSGVSGNIIIKLIKGTEMLGSIAWNVPNTGSYNWTINNIGGTPIRPGNDYKVLVRSFDDHSIEDQSNSNFSITSDVTGSISVTSPNGGESWAKGSIKTIRWNSTGVSGNVIIKLIKGTEMLGSIAWNVPNTGSYNWTINDIGGTPIQPGNNYKVLVRSFNDHSIEDQSDRNFTISSISITQKTVVSGKPSRPVVKAIEKEPSLKVIKPRGGEIWEMGSIEEIKWEAINIRSSKIHLMLYSVNGTSKRFVGFIKKREPISPNNYKWKVGEFSDGRSLSEGGQFQILISDRGGTITNYSDTFVIEEKKVDLRCEIKNLTFRTTHNFDIWNLILPPKALIEGIELIHVAEFDIILKNKGEWPQERINVEWEWEINSYKVKDGSIVETSERIDVKREGNTFILKNVGAGGEGLGSIKLHVKAGVPVRSGKMRIIVKAEVDPDNKLSPGSILKRDSTVNTLTVTVR